MHQGLMGDLLLVGNAGLGQAYEFEEQSYA
jgi:hypothetical protein